MKTFLSVVLAVGMLSALGFAFAYAVDREFAEPAGIQVHAANNTGNACKVVQLDVVINGNAERHEVEICN